MSYNVNSENGNLPLVGSSGEMLGMAVFGHGKEATVVPIYVSIGTCNNFGWTQRDTSLDGTVFYTYFPYIGHKVSIETAVTLVRACSKHRMPEPIRQADLRSREKIRDRKRS